MACGADLAVLGVVVEMKGIMSMKEVIDPEFSREHPRRMTKTGWWFRIVGGAVALTAAIVLSVIFVVTSLQMWWWQAWGTAMEVACIIIVVLFAAAIVWCYVSGFIELMRSRGDGSLVIVDDESSDEPSVESQIAQALTGETPVVKTSNDGMVDDSSVKTSSDSDSKSKGVIKTSESE